MPAILMTIVSALGSTVVNIIMKVIAGPALEKLVVEGLKMLAAQTDSKADDKLVKIVEDALNAKED